MTATPTPQNLDQEWRNHVIASSAVKEVAETLDASLRECIRAGKAYRLHKGRTITPECCDYGLIAELLVSLEVLVRDY